MRIEGAKTGKITSLCVLTSDVPSKRRLRTHIGPRRRTRIAARLPSSFQAGPAADDARVSGAAGDSECGTTVGHMGSFLFSKIFSPNEIEQLPNHQI